jgi:transposase
MKRFIEGEDRSQVSLLPECLDDYIGQDNPVRVVDAFVEEIELRHLGFESAEDLLLACRRVRGAARHPTPMGGFRARSNSVAPPTRSRHEP